MAVCCSNSAPVYILNSQPTYSLWQSFAQWDTACPVLRERWHSLFLQCPLSAGGWCHLDAFLSTCPLSWCGEGGSTHERRLMWLSLRKQQLQEHARVAASSCRKPQQCTLLLYYFFFANYFLRWVGEGKQESSRAAAVCACWQGTAKALEPALAQAKLQEVCEMGLDCFCSDKSSQHRHKCVFIEFVQSVLQSSRHRKYCLHELESTRDECRAGCKGKVWTSKQRGPTPPKFIYCCICTLRQVHWHAHTRPWSLPGAALGPRGRLPCW